MKQPGIYANMKSGKMGIEAARHLEQPDPCPFERTVLSGKDK